MNVCEGVCACVEREGLRKLGESMHIGAKLRKAIAKRELRLKEENREKFEKR